MPLVRKASTRMFGRFPAVSVDPDEAIVRGAAVQAGLKSRDSALKEVVLTDVCPYSLGVDVGERQPDGTIRGGLFSPIIERNTTIPASRVNVYSALQDNQKAILINIFQGESRLVADNIHLGQLKIPIPRGKAGEIPVECRFTYDINGLLEVDVTVPSTGEKRQLVINDDETIAPEDLAARRTALASLKVHPRDEDANRAALARAQRCYEEHLGDERHFIGDLISQFEAVLGRQDPRAAAQARKALLDALDRLEGEAFL
jgi:molecular chaperone HscC